jgi:hypothetical protein
VTVLRCDFLHDIIGRKCGNEANTRRIAREQFVREGIDVKMWDYIVRSALKLKVTPPTWIDIPQMMRLNVATYNVLKLLGEWDCRSACSVRRSALDYNGVHWENMVLRERRGEPCIRPCTPWNRSERPMDVQHLSYPSLIG